MVKPLGMKSREDAVSGLKEYLPDYMVPERTVVLESMPMTQNGKIDRRALERMLAESKTELREVGPDDLELLMELRMEVLGDVFASAMSEMPADKREELRRENEAYYREALGNGTHRACVAHVGGAIAGCGGLCIQKELPSPDNTSGICGYLMNVYTRPEYRGKGIGKAVTRWLIEAAREAGAGKVYLETTEQGEPVYRSCGFVDMSGYLYLRK